MACDPPLEYEVEDAVKEGVAAACSRGVVKGYPMVGLRVLVHGARLLVCLFFCSRFLLDRKPATPGLKGRSV
jgi:hypothetical protein